MALVHLQTSALSAEQKRRVGEMILAALGAEGIPAGHVVILFEPQQADLYLEGGRLLEGTPALPPLREASRSDLAQTNSGSSEVLAAAGLSAEPSRNERRPRKQETDVYRLRLVEMLKAKGSVNSFEAQAGLGLKDAAWAPALLRDFFKELEEEGVIAKEGQRRGTRYLWKGEPEALFGAPAAALPGPVGEPGTGAEEGSGPGQGVEQG